jgi:hypothetical protein
MCEGHELLVRGDLPRRKNIFSRMAVTRIMPYAARPPALTGWEFSGRKEKKEKFFRE